MKAIWRNTILAQSEDTIVIEGDHYFPPNSINKDHLRGKRDAHYCPWKGLASYYDVDVNGEVNKDAAWYYPAPKEAAGKIAGYVAFWKGVKVEQ